jgi:hypothetical protein
MFLLIELSCSQAIESDISPGLFGFCFKVMIYLSPMEMGLWRCIFFVIAFVC